MDHELPRLCKRMRDGIEVGDAKDYFEDVARVGPGGNFLMEESTVLACRSDEFCQPELADRNTYERWAELGRPDVYTKARERVEAILASPLKNPLPDAVIGKLEAIMRRADEDLK